MNARLCRSGLKVGIALVIIFICFAATPQPGREEAAESQPLATQLKVKKVEWNLDTFCAHVWIENQSKSPVDRLIIEIGADSLRPVRTTWNRSGSEAVLAPHAERSFEICDSSLASRKEQLTARVIMASAVIDLAKYSDLCDYIRRCEVNPEAKRLLANPEACEKMFAGLERSSQTMAFIPIIEDCARKTACSELETFKCFALSATRSIPTKSDSSVSP
ncbi:MAG TPA: hypothetical protein PKE49_08030 [Leptospiraceae bacterium]|nr:hypothetical protein [Leptospirales bacterium]HMU84717.1 hypothetical protein [Leptospiraceae bacterium]HMW61776.1 hypothetical protein [Leptospiraceae bacterium]HMX56458.1 hypothetical protein [Leptospiraceae bacterium]HMY43904.1 hypothetical protein [Leptospiraceae bacterium]